jgi:predicted acylesterase/phospholipase RssA
MLAYKFDIDQLIKRIQENSEDIARVARLPGRATMFSRACMGWPLIDERDLRGILKIILADPATLEPPGKAKREVTKIPINAAPIPLRILATDFVNSTLHVIENKPETPPDLFLLDALADSCAIPIAVRTFRNVKNSQRYIDGGVCDNLPSADIFGNNNLTIGFSFRTEPAQDSGKWNILKYASNLLSVAISRSVERTIVQLGETNVCRMQNQMDWLNFAEAVNVFTNPTRFKEATDEASNWLTNWVDAYQDSLDIVHDVRHEKAHLDLAKALMDAYKADAPYERLESLQTVSIITARSLDAAKGGIIDENVYHSKFVVNGDPVSWMRMWDMSYIGSPRHTEGTLSIVDKDGAEVKSQKFIALERVGTDGIGRSIFLNFVPPLTQEKSPYRLTHTVNQRSSLNGVFDPKMKCDYSWFASESFRCIQSMTLVVHYPKSVIAHDRDLFGDSKFPNDQGDGLQQTDSCTQAEIKALLASNSTSTPEGFKTLARKATKPLKRGEAIAIVVGIS